MKIKQMFLPSIILVFIVSAGTQAMEASEQHGMANEQGEILRREHLDALAMSPTLSCELWNFLELIKKSDLRIGEFLDARKSDPITPAKELISNLVAVKRSS